MSLPASAAEGPSDTAPPPDASPGIGRSAGLIGIATLTSRILGLIRDQVLAYLFGAGNAMDAFNVAFRIPNLVRDLFAEGAMSAAFVPTFTRYLTLRGKPAAWRLGNNVINTLIVVTLALVVAGTVWAGPLVTLFAEQYATVPGKLELTVRLTRIMMPFLMLVALAAVAMGMLNSLHRFFLPALSPAMFNIATIGCALGLVPVMPALGWPPIAAIALGTLVGGLGQLVVQWPALHREGYRYRPVLDLRDEGLRHVLLLMGPGTLGLAATQINLFVNTVLATSQGTGAVSWLNYAFRLMYLPIGLFGVSIATAALPKISRLAARNEPGGVRQTVAESLCMMFMLNVPATVGLIVLASPIVALIFERGQFSAADTAATAAALRCYAVGLIGYSAVRIASPTFYALQQSRVPVIVSAVTVAVNVALNLALVRVIGYRGLALGTALTALLNAGILLSLLRRRLHGLEGRRLTTALAKISLASAAMAIAAVASHSSLEHWWPAGGLLGQLVRVGTAIVVALAVLAGASRLLRIDEFTRARRAVTLRLGRRGGPR